MSNKDLFYSANIPVRHSKFLISESKSEVWTEKYKLLKEKVIEGGLIVIIGDRGTGKTQAGACALTYATEGLGKSALYTKALDMIHHFLDGMATASRRETTQFYIEPSVLLIDGLEVRTNSDFESRELTHIIDKRYDANKTTIIISNDQIEALQEFLGASVIERITEQGSLFIFDGESFRQK